MDGWIELVPREWLYDLRVGEFAWFEVPTLCTRVLRKPPWAIGMAHFISQRAKESLAILEEAPVDIYAGDVCFNQLCPP